MGAGAGKRLSAVRWGVAGNIIAGWVVTLPAAAIFGGLVDALSSLFGHNAIGPLVISIALLLMLAAVFARRAQQSTPAPAAS
jgi:PiT family inorganic phosphate transporter